MDPAGTPLIVFVLFLLLSILFFGLPSAWLASQRGRSAIIWALVAALLLGPVAILVVGLAQGGRRTAVV